MIPALPSALSSAMAGLQRHARAVDRAAGTIARAGLEPASPAPGASSPATPGASAPPADELAGAMVDMLVAQRMFSAQLRVIRTADEMMQEAVELPRSASR